MIIVLKFLWAVSKSTIRRLFNVFKALILFFILMKGYLSRKSKNPLILSRKGSGFKPLEERLNKKRQDIVHSQTLTYYDEVDMRINTHRARVYLNFMNQLGNEINELENESGLAPKVEVSKNNELFVDIASKTPKLNEEKTQTKEKLNELKHLYDDMLTQYTLIEKISIRQSNNLKISYGRLQRNKE